MADNNTALTGNEAKLSERLQRLETLVESLVHKKTTTGHGAAGDVNNTGRRHVDSEEQPTLSAAAGWYSELQNEFRAIKENVAEIKLPADLMLSDNRSGVSRADLPKFEVIQKSARFQETALKLLSTLEGPEPKLSALTTVTLAHLRYLQDENKNLLASSQSDERRSKPPTTQQQDPTGLPATSALENLHRAIAVEAASPQLQVSAGVTGDCEIAHYATPQPRQTGTVATADEHKTNPEENMATVVSLGNDAPQASLDHLPMELLLVLFSWLDWWSLLTLERVSVYFRDAVALYIGRLHFFTIDDSAWYTVWPDEEGTYVDIERMYECSEVASTLTAALSTLLSRMVELRELYVDMCSSENDPESVLLAGAVSASRHWPLLDRLKLMWPYHDLGPDHDLLRQLCTNCGHLTSVAFDGNVSDAVVEAVVTKLPALRTLHVISVFEMSGSFLSLLPTDLRNLSVACSSFHSWRLSDLLRCRELRSLSLRLLRNQMQTEPAQLVSVLVGCVHLERLSVCQVDAEFVNSLPPDGLLTLRHLTITYYDLMDEDFNRLVERLPSLESVTLVGGNTSLTPRGLAPLGRLPALSSLCLKTESGTEHISDWVLIHLSAAPLVELELPVVPLLDGKRYYGGSKSFTVNGVLYLIRRCRSLRVLVLYPPTLIGIRKERISCGDGVQERDVEHAIRLFVDRVNAVSAQLFQPRLGY